NKAVGERLLNHGGLRRTLQKLGLPSGQDRSNLFGIAFRDEVVIGGLHLEQNWIKRVWSSITRRQVKLTGRRRDRCAAIQPKGPGAPERRRDDCCRCPPAGTDQEFAAVAIGYGFVGVGRRALLFPIQLLL